MSREFFHIDEQAIRTQYEAMQSHEWGTEMVRLQEAFSGDVALGDMLEDSAQLEEMAIETRARMRILEGIINNARNEHDTVRRVRHNQASERPEARIMLAAKFALMSDQEKRMELVRAQDALDEYDQAELSSETSFEDPLMRGHRIRMEVTVELLSRDVSVQPS